MNKSIQLMTVERNALQSNLRDAWAALDLLRETVETLGPVGCMRSSEFVSCHVAPTFDAHARELIAGIRAISEAPRQDAPMKHVRTLTVDHRRPMRVPGGAS